MLAVGGPARHARLAQGQPDEDVEHRDDGHGQHEEQEGGRLQEVAHQRHLVRADVALQRVGNGAATTGVVDEVEGASVHGVGQSTEAGQPPHGHNGPHRPTQGRHGGRLDWVTDGHVSLHRKGRDGEHGRRAGHLGQEDLEDTEGFAEHPRVGAPDGVQLGWQG